MSRDTSPKSFPSHLLTKVNEVQKQTHLTLRTLGVFVEMIQTRIDSEKSYLKSFQKLSTSGGNIIKNNEFESLSTALSHLMGTHAKKATQHEHLVTLLSEEVLIPSKAFHSSLTSKMKSVVSKFNQFIM